MYNGEAGAVISQGDIQTEQYLYTAYGLGISSAIPLPELVASSPASSDVVIRPAELAHLVSNPQNDIRRATPEEILFHYPVVGTFLIRNGKEILFDTLPGLEEVTIRLFLTSICLGAILHQRKLLVLHASAALVNNHVAVFIGEKGWGKSTIAAGLYHRGYALITDDVLAISILEESPPRVIPSFPQVKLWPDALQAALVTGPEGLPRVHSSLEKRMQTVDGWKGEPPPLGCVFVLGVGSELSIRRLSVQEAFPELVRHSYMRRVLAASGASATHFRQCTALMSAVPVVRLTRTRDLGTLPVMIEKVEAYMNDLGARRTVPNER